VSKELLREVLELLRLIENQKGDRYGDHLNGGDCPYYYNRDCDCGADQLRPALDLAAALRPKIEAELKS